MIAADLPPLWLPAKPAIIRPAEHALLRPGAFRPMTAAERDATIAELVRSKRLTPNEAKQAMFFVPAAMWAKKPKVLTFVGEVTQPSSASTYTFTNAAIGTASADRRLIIAAHAQNGNDSANPTMTVGGNSATFIDLGFLSSAHVALFIISFPTGTTATVVVTWAASQTEGAIGVWNATGLTSNTPVDHKNNTNNSGNPTLTLSSVANGFAIAAYTDELGTALSWTGVTGQYGSQIHGHSYMAGAHAAPTTGSNLTITATPTNGDRRTLVAATF